MPAQAEWKPNAWFRSNFWDVKHSGDPGWSVRFIFRDQPFEGMKHFTANLSPGSASRIEKIVYPQSWEHKTEYFGNRRFDVIAGSVSNLNDKSLKTLHHEIKPRRFLVLKNTSHNGICIVPSPIAEIYHYFNENYFADKGICT